MQEYTVEQAERLLGLVEVWFPGLLREAEKQLRSHDLWPVEE